jgi:hypothetical protein
VTRASIIELARSKGYEVKEEPVSVHEAMEVGLGCVGDTQLGWVWGVRDAVADWRLLHAVQAVEWRTSFRLPIGWSAPGVASRGLLSSRSKCNAMHHGCHCCYGLSCAPSLPHPPVLQHVLLKMYNPEP